MERRPDVALLALNYPPEPTGIAPYTGSLAAGLLERGLSTSVHAAHPHYPDWAIYPEYGEWTRREVVDGIEVCRRLHYVPRTPRGVRRLLSELSYGARLAVCRWGDPKVVLAVSPSLFSTALVLLRVRLTGSRSRVVVWVQDIYTLGLAETGEGFAPVRSLIRWVESRTLRSADRVVVIHPRFAEYLSAELDVSKCQIAVIRNWTHLSPTADITRAEARAKLGWPEDLTLAVHTGNMGAKQGLENIVEAARLADLREETVQFILVGDGGERRRLESEADGISRISFVEPLDDVNYRLALAAADVLLVNELPGVSGMAVPSKLTSYFDAGRPVVAATDPGGITAKEVLASGAGVTVPAGQPSLVLNAVLDIRADEERSSQMAKNGRSYRRRLLDMNVAIDKWYRLVRDLQN